VIRVDGPRETGYTKVVSGTTKLHVSVRGDRPKRTVRDGLFSVRVGGGSAGGRLTENWTKYEISFPYKAPLDSTTDTANDRFDPIPFCDATLRRAKGDQRARFLKKGSRTTLHDAYALKGEVVWTVKKGSVLREQDQCSPRDCAGSYPLYAPRPRPRPLWNDDAEHR